MVVLEKEGGGGGGTIDCSYILRAFTLGLCCARFVWSLSNIPLCVCIGRTFYLLATILPNGARAIASIPFRIDLTYRIFTGKRSSESLFFRGSCVRGAGNFIVQTHHHCTGSLSHLIEHLSDKEYPYCCCASWIKVESTSAIGSLLCHRHRPPTKKQIIVITRGARATTF
jgi:hypothetical protein